MKERESFITSITMPWRDVKNYPWTSVKRWISDEYAARGWNLSDRALARYVAEYKQRTTNY